jgi:penicillin amidase
MMALQNDLYSSTANMALPFFFKYLDEENLSNLEKNYLKELKNWNFKATADSRAPTIYQAWFDSIKNNIFNDEFSRIHPPKVRPEEQTLIEALLKDSAYRFVDDINTPQVETLKQQVTRAFHAVTASLYEEEKTDGLTWWKHRNPSIPHILSTVKPLGREGIHVGGWYNTINAITETHGPSWRMIVQLSEPIVAYGIFPGGENGNPGSKYYENFIDDWAKGKYYTLWMMKENENKDKRIIGTLTFTHSDK